MPQMQSNDQTLTVLEAAAYLSIKPKQMRKLAPQFGVKFGRQWRFSKNRLDNYLQQKPQEQ